MINVTLIGNLTAKAEVHESEKGNFTSFTVASNKSVKDKEGQRVQVAEYVSVVKSCSAVDPYLEQGKKVCVYGTLDVAVGRDQWNNAEAKIRVRAIDVQLI